MFTSVLLVYSAEMVSSKFCWSRRRDAGTRGEGKGGPLIFGRSVMKPYSNQVGGADSVYSLQLATSNFFHLSPETGIKAAENWVNWVSFVNRLHTIIESYFNFRFKPGDRTSKSLRMIHNCDPQQPQAQPQLCQADVVAWWPLKTPFWIRWSKRPQLKEAIRVIFNEIDILFLKLQFSFSKQHIRQIHWEISSN